MPHRWLQSERSEARKRRQARDVLGVEQRVEHESAETEAEPEGGRGMPWCAGAGAEQDARDEHGPYHAAERPRRAAPGQHEAAGQAQRESRDLCPGPVEEHHRDARPEQYVRGAQ